MVIALEWKRDAEGVTESIHSQHVSSSKALLVSYLVVRERVSRGSRCGRTPRFESRLRARYLAVATRCGDALRSLQWHARHKDRWMSLPYLKKIS